MSDENRRITDSKVLSAMAHPLRRRLLDVLKVNGPATVSALADHTGQAVGNVSHHMKVLAAAELVEEAPEAAHDRREHWWRLRVNTINWSQEDFADDPAGSAVAEAAYSLNLDHQISMLRQWTAGRDGYEKDWQEAAFSTDYWLRLSASELEKLSDEIIALLNRWHDREIPDDSQQRDAVFVFAHGVPAKP